MISSVFHVILSAHCSFPLGKPSLPLPTQLSRHAKNDISRCKALISMRTPSFIHPIIAGVERAAQGSREFYSDYSPPRVLIFLMMITSTLSSQYDWEESQPERDNVPSQNRVPVTCRWDSVSVTLSSGMRARTPFARRTSEPCGMSITGKEYTYATHHSTARATDLWLT